MSSTNLYTTVAPQCPCCTTVFDQTADHKETLIEDDQLQHLVECGQCGRPWVVVIDYNLPVNGVEIWVKPDIIEYQYRHRDQNATDFHATLPKFNADNRTDSMTDDQTLAEK